jgi:hypothetical protein
MKNLTPNEMAVARYKISQQLAQLSKRLKDPNEDYRNVCDVMDGLGHALYILDNIRHSAFPEWFEKKPKTHVEDGE